MWTTFKIKFIAYFIVMILSITNGYMTPAMAVSSSDLFKLSLQRKGSHLVIAHWDIASNCHLYKQSISIKTTTGNHIKIGKILLPAGQQRWDTIVGKYQVYRHHLDVKIPIPVASVGTLRLQIHYQGCQGNIYCYPPVSKVLSMVLK